MTPLIGATGRQTLGPQARVWSNVNAVSSAFKPADVFLNGLREGALELNGEWIHVDGRVTLGGNFSHDPNVDVEKMRLRTDDRFDMVQLYHSLDSLHRRIGDLGYDVPAIRGGIIGKPFSPLRAHAHGTDMVNAWFDSRSGELTFGLGKVGDEEKWHLGSDGDVAVHEAGHEFLYHLRPGLGGPGGREGEAFHEGFGDALAAFQNGDPELSEDYVFALNGILDDKKGMRTADNELALTDVSDEVHDRGRLYAGFFWSLLGRLARLRGGEAPFDTGLRLLLNTGGNFQTDRPHTGSVVEAMLLGTKALVAANAIDFTYAELETEIKAEARKRLLIGHFDEVGSPIFDMTETELVRQLGGPQNILLIPANITPTLGGLQTVLQEHFLSPNHGVIMVIGAQITVTQWAFESGSLLTLRDARPIANGEIDETIQITFEQAVKGVHDQVLAKLEAAKRELSRIFLEMGGFPRNRHELKHFAETQEEIEFLEEVLRLIQQEFQNGHIGKKFCILPGKNRLHYKLEIGPFIFYVDSQLGEISSFRQRFT